LAGRTGNSLGQNFCILIDENAHNHSLGARGWKKLKIKGQKEKIKNKEVEKATTFPLRGIVFLLF
jgi:hypothetical protein